ncbi:hypothetical protein DYQ86_26930 [Acidobacteria bacterium AB60]|nr:hypothetical protein DYQ86_26930 [Acidobacteria bacterium AB60]
MIRQAISCDVCGAEKKQTNHWFIASEQGGELRVSGWGARNRLRAGTKHLCGQTCLHKLMDEFMARTIAAKTTAPPAEAAGAAALKPPADVSLTSKSAYLEHASGANGSGPTAPIAASPRNVVPLALSGPASRPAIEEKSPAPAQLLDEVPNYASRRWRAEAWERERALHATERRGDSSIRHRKAV